MSKVQFIEVRELDAYSNDDNSSLMPKSVKDKLFKDDIYKYDVFFIYKKSFKYENFDINQFLAEKAEDSFFRSFIIPIKDMVVERYQAKLLFGNKGYSAKDYYYLDSICKIYHPLLPKDGILTPFRYNYLFDAIEKSNKICIDWEDLFY